MRITRYQALRRMGCDPITAATVALLNWVRGVPAGVIALGMVVIEIED